MTADRIFRGLFVLYLLAFVIYLFAPLLIMSVAAFNTSRFPTVIPWQGTTMDWFSAMWADAAMWRALWTSAIVAVLVVMKQHYLQQNYTVCIQNMQKASVGKSI